jgi:probable H4MPT-linked C1 transfer pathway protein
MNVIGLDIGGANLKAADVNGRAVARGFALWKQPEQLTAELAALLADFDTPDCLAVTMTAELADCYRSKSDGVDRVLRAVEEVAGGARVFVWQTGAEFVSPEVAREIPLLVAAANWHALATWIGRMAPSSGALLIDIGSTTTDLIPLQDGVPVPDGMTDCERLCAGELVYSGVRRTPLCAIAHSVPFDDGYCPLAAELFATTLDVYLTLGWIPEDETDRETADGRPATMVAAHERLSRMLCCDASEFTRDDAEIVARFLGDVQRQRITGALDRVLRNQQQPCEHVLISGSGSFLAEAIVREHRQLYTARTFRLSECLTPAVAQSACAVAVAHLGHERLGSF